MSAQDAGTDAVVAARPGRQGLLDRVVDHMLATGTAAPSLRALAGEIGTSHRMLIYHFGGYDGLIAAVVGEVEARQQEALAALGAMPQLSLAELSWAFWKRLSAPGLATVERLFFVLDARLLEAGRTEEATRLSTGWHEQAATLLVARGVSRGRARRLARLGTAVTRGLLLDLLATGDRRAVDAAARTYIDAMFDQA